MDYGFDASGSEDDVTRSQHVRSFGSGRVDGSEKEINGACRGQRSTDVPLEKLEYDAYVAVLRAFTKQTGALAWDKCEIMAKLREHLRITMDQHLKILHSIESNIGHCASREQKPQDDEHIGPIYARSSLLATDVKQRKQKIADTSQGSLPPAKIVPPPSPSSGRGFSGRRDPPVVSIINKKNKAGFDEYSKAISSSATGSGTINSLIGRRVQTRWPDDNAFYEAQIIDYNPENDKHALVYNANAVDESWEWVNVKELLSSGDLKFVDGVPPISAIGKGTFKSGVMGGKHSERKDRSGKVRNICKGTANSFEEPAPSVVHGRNWKNSSIQEKGCQKIQLPSLDALIKRVDRIAREDDLAKIESVKRAAKEHEEMLRKALAEIGEFSDEEESSGCRGSEGDF